MDYAISVRGHLSPSVAAAFDDFEIRDDEGATVLRGEIVDRAALYGVINRLERFGLDLVDLHACPPPRDHKHPIRVNPTIPAPLHDQACNASHTSTNVHEREDHP